MARTNQLSRGGALAIGAVCIGFGIFPILLAAGVLKPSDGDAPGWVAGAAGALFICAGLDIIIDFAIADGIGPDGDFKPGTSSAVRVANFLFGLTIVGLMTSVFGWVAFGAGPRQFTSTVTLPFLPASRWHSGELSGRIVFGACAVLFAVAFVGCGISGARRLRRGIIVK